MPRRVSNVRNRAIFLNLDMKYSTLILFFSHFSRMSENNMMNDEREVKRRNKYSSGSSIQLFDHVLIDSYPQQHTWSIIQLFDHI